MQTIEFVLTGDRKMICVACETRIAYGLRQLSGVKDVRASASTQQVHVLLERAGTIGAEQIAEKLKELGYQTTLIGGAA